MNNEKLNEQLNNLITEGESYYKAKTYDKALKTLHDAYRLAKRLQDAPSMYKCAFLLKEICLKLAQNYYDQAAKLDKDNKSSETSKLLDKAKKIAQIGIFYEKPFKENKNENLLTKIKTLIDLNNKKIIEERKKKIRSFKAKTVKVLGKMKNKAVDIFEDVGDFISGMFYSGSTTSYSSSENSNDDDKNDVSYNEETEKQREEAVSYYNGGIDSFNSRSINPISYLYSAISSFEKCYRLSKGKFPDLAYDALKMIAESYYELGRHYESEGDRCCYNGSYQTAMSHYNDALKAFKEGQECLPSDCHDYFVEAINRADSSYYNADYAWRYDD